MTDARQLVPSSAEGAPPALLPYQAEAVASDARVNVWEKSRRIGASWALAELAAETSASAADAGGMDTLYIGYNLDMAREFIDDAAFWAGHLAAFAGEAPEIREMVFEDRDPATGETRAIKAYRIDFASGFSIQALSSRPRSLRGRQGLVIIDEAAFHDDLAGLIKAALALLIWGGRVWIVSTHLGADNPFNELVEDIRAGRRPYRLFRTTFDDALAEGFYERNRMVLEARGQEVAPKEEWVAAIRADYGENAAEELDVVPSQGSGVWLTRAVIDACMNAAFPVVYRHFEDGFELMPDHVREAAVEAWLEDEVAPLMDALDPALQSFLGGDFGRSGDLSVLWPGQLSGARLVVPFAVELRNCPFRQQEQVLNFVADRLPRFMAGKLDARGLGAALAEFAVQRYGTRIERVMATREWYREHMPPFKARFEDTTVEIPRDDDVRQDLRAVRLDKGVPIVPEGARTRSVRGGQRHGDAAIAGVLLNAAAAMDVADYGYLPAPRARPMDERPGVDADDEAGPRAGRGAFAGIRGAW